MFQVTNITLILFITTAINFIATVIGWQRVKNKDGLYFALGMAALTCWTLAAGFDYASVPIPWKVFFAKLEYAGYNSAFVFFALFALSYAGYEEWLKKFGIKFFFYFVWLSNVLLAWTNDWHGWLWNGFVRSDFGDNTVIFKHGPGYIWAVFTGYLMILIIIVPLWIASRKGVEYSRRQARFLFFASLVPMIGNLLYLLENPEWQGIDWSSITFSVAGLLFLLALYGTRLLDLTPIARDRVLAGISDGIIVLDLGNRVIDANQMAVTMTQSSAEFMIGKTLEKAIPSIPMLSELASEQTIHTELELGGKTKRHLEVLISRLYGNHDTVIGRLVILRDISERKENELRILQLTQAIEQSPASVMITDSNGRITYVNPQVSVLTGYTTEEILGKNPNIMQSGQTSNDVYKDMWNTINSGRTWHGEFLNRKKNGELYWEDAVIAPVTDPQGTLISYISVKVDITKRKNAENALRNSEERFRQLVTSAPDAVFGIDANGDIVFANHEAASLLGYDEDELIGKNIETLVPMELRAQHIQHRANYFAHPQTRSMGVDRELKAKRKNGAEIPVEINLSWSATEKGTLAIAHMRDVTQRKIAEAALRNANQQLESQLREIENLQTSLLDQAVRDPLTQLHNRRFLNEAIEQEFHHAQRASETLSVILLDIDHFKIINDTFGHLAGDTCLVMLANLIRQYIRKSDISCRYGGEEFLLLLPATNAEGATQYAERLRDLVAHQVLTVDGEQIQFTVSLGIASFPEDGASYTEIINKADDAMYMSKKAGRNRVTVWSTGVGGVQN